MVSIPVPNIRRWAAVACAATLFCCGMLPAKAASVPNELLVKLRRAPQVRGMDAVDQTGSSILDELALRRQAMVTAPLNVFARRFRSVESLVLVRLTPDVSADSVQSALAADPGVEWVSPNHCFTVSRLDGGSFPSDSLFSRQWWLTRISAPAAWELSRGDSAIVIGVIDTGVDYLHPDLERNIWRNWADADGDGVDSDGNGFIDDYIGWDFVDAPSLPSRGDFLQRDNDPMDEHGHGTIVGGIAAAVTDNETCLASVGFNCRIMCLRAGNADGFLEEDDVAAAILYAAQMGANVLNLSFGDVVVSPLLRETVRIAYDAGVVIVGSAGNNVSDAIHYPSGYPEVISVGASDSRDRLAAFSNYGPFVDLLAPGVDILSASFHYDTTGLVHDCGGEQFYQGTSFAAPLAAGAAGLMLAVNPQLSPDAVKQILRSTADDIAQSGWDSLTVHGRLNVRRAVEQAAFGSHVFARIAAPANDQGVRADFAVSGEARGAAFERWTLSYGVGENPPRWHVAATGHRRMYNDSLGIVPIPAIDTVIVVRLEAAGTDGQLAIDHVHIRVQRTAPVIDSIKVRRMLDWDTYGDLVEVWTNQITSASLLLTNAAGDSIREDFGYVDRRHATPLSQTAHPGRWDVRVRLVNAADLDVISAPFTFEVAEPPFVNNLWIRAETNLTHGFIGAFVTDLNCNGRPEVWRAPIVSSTQIATLEPFEWSGTAFAALPYAYGVHIPQSVGDADGDGLLEIMARVGELTRIWEQSDPCRLPDRLVYEASGVVGAGFAARDSSTSGAEIILRRNTSANGLSAPRYILYRANTDYTLTATDTIPNGTQGTNGLGSPGIICGDLDQDGRWDVLYGDYDGDVIFCEMDAGRVRQSWTTRLPMNDATAWLAAGDFDGDTEVEFIAGCRSNNLGGTESQVRARRWEYFVFERTGDNEFAVVDSVFILGNTSVTLHPASATAADLDGDGAAEILISAYPDFYIIRYDSPSGRYRPVWHRAPNESNNAVIYDWNGDGLQDALVTDGTRFEIVSVGAPAGRRPPPPLHLRGEPLGPSDAELTWSPVAVADSYAVYRAQSAPDFVQIAVTADTSLRLSDLPEDVSLTYAVTSLNPAYPDGESVRSNYVVVTANLPPAAEDTALFLEPNIVRIRFSEPMGEGSAWQWSYRLGDGRMPAVVSPGEAGRVIYLTFDGVFETGWHNLFLSGLRDAQGSRLPAAESSLAFVVERMPELRVYVLSHRLSGGAVSSQVEITFSAPMSESALNPANYLMEEPRSVISVAALTADQAQVRLQMDPRYPVGAIGLPARIILRGLISADGLPLDTTDGRGDLVLGGAAESVTGAYVFPNPYKGIGPAGESCVHFAGLPEQATIRVFTLQGLVVRTLEFRGYGGAAKWDLKNDNGHDIAGGIYLYSIESGGETVRGKLAVLR